ncbi:MAG: hypothetical protein WBC68_07935 [Albidovulum sp.]
MRQKESKTFRQEVDHTILYNYETGRVQLWYEMFLTSLGLDPKASLALQLALLFGKKMLTTPDDGPMRHQVHKRMSLHD